MTNSLLFGSQDMFTQFPDTTDVQNATVSDTDNSNSVTISCNFMTGSKARGCVVVLVGEVTNTTVVLKREGVATAELPHPLGCYSDVIVFDIEADGSNGTFPVPGTLVTQGLQLDQCAPTTEELTPARGKQNACLIAVYNSMSAMPIKVHFSLSTNIVN